MKIGDLVQYKGLGSESFVELHGNNFGVILDINDSHRQRWCTLLMPSGKITKPVWLNNLEVVSESG